MKKQMLAGLIAGALVLTPAVLGQGAAADAPAKAPEKKKRLVVGDAAPSLEGIKWHKGEPITGFQAGQVYVLDFWATWCGPCIAAIPHMNEMHGKLKDKGVNVVGLAIWPRSGMKPVKDFVEARGDKMAYRIGEDVDNKLANSYMRPAGQNGIPCVFIVDQKGKIAWIGHPMDGMDDVVDEVVKGEFDPVAYEKKKEEREAASAKLEEAFEEALKSGDSAKGLEAAEALMKFDAKKYTQLKIYKYVALNKLGKGPEAKAFGAGLVEEAGKDADFLNFLAWTIVDPEGDFAPGGEKGGEALKPDADLALMAATKASELKGGNDPAVLDTLARAHFVKGDFAKAVEVQTKAIDSADEDFKEQLRSALEEYKTAQEKKQ